MKSGKTLNFYSDNDKLKHLFNYLLKISIMIASRYAVFIVRIKQYKEL